MRTFSPLRLAALVLPLLALALIFGAPGGPVVRADHAQGPLPPGPGVDLVYAKCQQCHPLRYVTESAGLPPFLWQDTLDLMQQLGLQLTEEEEETLYDYFVTYMGPDGPPEGSGDDHGESNGSDESASGDAAAQSGDAGANDGSDAASDAASDDGNEDGNGDGTGSESGADGAAVYSANCASCHGAEGQGVQGAFPPLVEHAPALAAADRDYLPLVLVHGLQGEITVQGASYRGVMPAWAQLSDGEIAAVLDHILTSWGNAYPEGVDPYAPSDVAAARELELSSAQVLERRPALGE